MKACLSIMNEEIRGLAFPFHLTECGTVAQCIGMEKLKQNIIHILLTISGERVMRRTYGGGLRQLIHDPNNEALRAVVQHEITKALEQWEPRVQVESLTISQEQKEGILNIDLRYRVRQTQQPQSVLAYVDLRSV